MERQVVEVWKLQSELQDGPVAPAGVMQLEGGERTVEMVEILFGPIQPQSSVEMLDGEGVNMVQGSEVVEVRRQCSWGERRVMGIKLYGVADEHLLSVLEEAAFTRTSQKAEFMIS